MSLKKKSNFIHTLTFRLTLWYAVMLGVLSMAVFLFIYITLTSSLNRRTDQDLLNTASEFEALYNSNGIKALESEFRREAEARGIKRIFFRFLSSKKNIILFSNLYAWKGLKSISFHYPETPDTSVTFETISLPEHRHKVRVVLKRIDDNHFIQIGMTLQENEALMEKYRETFGTAITVILLCGCIAGFFIANRAMSGVERVTQTAIRIGKGDLSRRVPPGKEGQEIDNLAQAFNDMLERIKNLIDELEDVTNSIAHDLRSPITSIRGIAETTLTGGQTMEAYREMAGTVVEESDKLVEMINTMLEIARTDSGVLEFSRTTVDMGKIIKDAVELFRPVAEDQHILLEFDIPGEPLTVSGDITRLQRLMANLIDNAIKFIPVSDESGIEREHKMIKDRRTGLFYDNKVSISAQVSDKQVKIEIADTGGGITEKDFPHIFERFYRGDKSRSTPGSGLGLSLALSIVRVHGGDITVKSSPGKGSIFTVLLPHTPSLL